MLTVVGNIFMIWPEFEDSSGNIILDDKIPVPFSGTARMWIISEERIQHHQDRITLGAVGYFMEGSRRVVEYEVVELNF